MSLDQIASDIRNAYITQIPIDPIRTHLQLGDIDAAYKIQHINHQHRLSTGVRMTGKKIGLTSPAVQNQLGVDQPDFGILYSDMAIDLGSDFSVANLMQGKAEAEIGLVLSKDLKMEHMGLTDLISAIDYVVPAIEIVGSRIKNWDISILDTVADNASSSHYVLGHSPKRLFDVDILNATMVMYNHDKVVSEGKGQNCMGSPLNAALWLANKMVEMGNPLKKGELILTGALGPMVTINPGDHFKAIISGLGTVEVSFSA